MARLDAAPVTLSTGTEPFSLKPIIDDIIRTRFCIPNSIFLVEGVDAVPVTRTGRWQALRLLLGDGELCIQALLDDAMHRFVFTGDISVGCYVQVQRFELRWRNVSGELAPGRHGHGEMVYLVLRDLVTIGWNESVRTLHLRGAHDPVFVDKDKAAAEVSSQGGRKTRDDDKMQRANDLQGEDEASLLQPQQHEGEAGLRRQDIHLDAENANDADVEDAFNTFEALVFTKQQRSSRCPGPSRPAAAVRASHKPLLPISLPKDWHDPQTPLKLTTLRSIPHLPYKQNWSCNVLAIVASLSPIEPSHLVPYKQRTARIADPSTAKQVHLTVFLDPEEFAPRVGSAVLLTGVKNHRFDGGSLKKYASDRRADGSPWWFEEPWELAWCDVAGIKRWWDQMEAAQAT